MGEVTDLPLSEDVIVRCGGWDPRFARVVLIEQSGVHALVLVDGNGDGAELELEHWEHNARDGWRCRTSSGFGPLDTLETVDAWDTGDLVCAVGRVTPDAVVRVAYGDRTYSRRANSLGIWGFVHQADSPHAGEVPRLGR
jgi:hypothetical protein